MNEFFNDNADVGTGSEEALLKSLYAGAGTDAAMFTGGRALQAENCETTLINVMREQQEDFKLMNTIKKNPVRSTVYQYNVRTDYGNEDLGFVSEGEGASNNNQDIARKTLEMKFIQKYSYVTKQAELANTFENAFEVEKVASTLSVLRTAEKYCFHGDSGVVGKQFDGFLKIIRDTPANMQNIYDLRGRTISAEGERILTHMAEMIADKGGEANKIFYPLILGNDLQELVRDRLRFGVHDKVASLVVEDYPTVHGSMKIAGSSAGTNKMFHPKGVIKPGGDIQKLPAKPASVTLAAAASSASQFMGTQTGNFTYTVHAVNEFGVSEGTSASLAVASGEAVTLTITPNAVNPGTGFIICRTAPNGDTAMEMVRIGRDLQNANTIYLDKNDDLPGTAEMLFLTEKKLQAVTEFLQFHPLQLYRLFPVNALITPFVMALWGAPNMKAPHWCGYVKNIAYRGGL